jgi:nucleotide-binding universal stress UspA family protein
MTLTAGQPGTVSGQVTAGVSRVIVGVDDSESGLAALAAATELARASGAPLVAVRAWALGLPRHGGRRMRHLAHPHVVLSFSGAEQRLAANVFTRKAFRAAIDGMPAEVDVTIATPNSDPALALVDLAGRPGDVIVVGIRGGHLARSLIHGSVARYCVRRAHCPVVLVPPAAD